MSKTVIRGCWPGKKNLTIIEEAYTPPDRHAHVRGKSKYAEIIAGLIKAPPGKVAAYCPTRLDARALVHGLVRYLKQNGLYEKLRPATKSEGEAAKVWVVKR